MKKKICFVLMLMLLFCVCALCACHEHTFSEWVVTKQPTCTQVGQKVRDCECGESETEIIFATGHTEGEWMTDVEPTCTTQGSKHQVCSVCGYVLKIQSIDAIGHNCKPTVTEPTCTQKGYTTHTCNCGYSYVDTYVNATGHTFGKWTVTTQPTCTQQGQKQRTCACGAVEAESIAQNGHTQGEWTTDVEPTCTTQGSKHQVCSVCGDVLKIQSIDATGHTFENWVVARDSTCTELGFELGFCSCGSVQKRTIDAKGHTAGEWTTDSEPTCTVAGSKHQVCSVCGDTIKTESINATGHDYSDTVIPPTCTTQGYTLHTCSVCGDVCKDTFVPTNGEHNFKEADTCAYCEENISTVAVDSYNMSASSSDNVRGYVVPRANGKYDAYIKGSGKMKDYSVFESPFYVDEFSGKIVNAYIANAVTNIGTYVFYDCEFKNISIPDSVIAIDAYAFQGCNALTSVTFGENSQLSSIGERAFWGHSKLTSIVLPANVTFIGDWAFASCSHLTNIVIPNSVTSIGDNAFYQCSQLANITIEGTPKIGEKSFYGTAYYENTNNWQNKVLYIGNCLIEAKTTIETCTIKEGTTVIADYAFKSCSSLSNITIPNSIIRIGSCAFDSCTNLASIAFEDPNGWYGSSTANGTIGTALSLTSPTQNATYLKDTYHNYDLYKTTPSVTPTTDKSVYLTSVVTEPVVGTTYKLALWQANAQKVLYATSEMSDSFIATTEDVTKAAYFKLEATIGGYFLNLGGKYITLTGWSGTFVRAVISLTDTASTVFTIGTNNELIASVSAKDNNGAEQTRTFFVGTYGTNNTISASLTDYISDTTWIDSTQFPARIVAACFSIDCTSGPAISITKEGTYKDYEGNDKTGGIQKTMTVNGITVINDIGTSTTAITTQYDTADRGNIRFYSGSTLTIKYSIMKKIVITTDGEKNFNDDIAVSGATVTVDGTTLTIILDEATDSITFTITRQVRVTNITVYTGLDSAA